MRRHHRGVRGEDCRVGSDLSNLQADNSRVRREAPAEGSPGITQVPSKL